MRYVECLPPLFLVGVRDFDVSPELFSFMKLYKGIGIALFNSPHDSPHNIWKEPQSALERVHEFVSKVRPLCNFLAVDQEGGRVKRFRSPFIDLPSPQQMAQAFRSGLTMEVMNVYEGTASQMRQSGIDVNLAPVVDIRYSESNSIIGDRSFGSSKNEILPLAKIFCSIFEKNGVRTVLKHFPGHGPSTFDSHENIAVLFKNRNEVYRDDAQVFVDLAEDCFGILTAHISFPDDPERIYSLSKNDIEEAKMKIGSGKIWFTDDLLFMKSVSEKKPWRSAFDCSYDFITVCDTLDKAANAIEDTIRYAESKNLTYAENESLEKRAMKNLKLFHLNPITNYSKWMPSIKETTDKVSPWIEKINAIKQA